MALVIVDVLVDNFEQQARLSRQRGPLTAAINTLVRAFRSVGHPVMWIRQEFKPDLSDAFLEMRRSGVKVTIEGTEGCRILPELERAADDIVIVKKRYSAFFRTTLDEVLDDWKPSALVLAGVNTHACIRTTAIDAYQRDYDVIVASDCVSSYDEEHHRVTLRYLDGKIARVMDNNAIVGMLPSGVPSHRDGPSARLRT